MTNLAPDTRGFLQDVILLEETLTEKAKELQKENPKEKGSGREKERRKGKEKNLMTV
jgi:hypothetical protein